jgi:hypothetical protein
MKFNIRFLFALVILSSCFNDYEERTRIETVPAFNVIRLQSVFTVVLRTDSEYSVTIVGDDDVISEIELKSDEGTLFLLNHAKGTLMNPERNTVVVEIAAPYFHTFISEDSYALSTAGTLTFDHFYIWNYPEVKVSEIKMDVDGGFLFYWNNWLAGGKLTLTGNVESTDLRNDALHLIDASDLVSNYTTIHNYGREDCEVRATTALQYRLNGPGNIVVYGHPPEMVLLEKTSTGKLIIAN